ncbi:hypothetical protein BH23PLA1_BH23PLA1_44260 [soil metagenome]
MDNPYEAPNARQHGPGSGIGPDGSSGSSRPTVVTVFGILALIYGGVGLLCNPVNAAVNLAVDLQGELPDDPIMQIAVSDTYRLGIGIYSIACFGFCLVLTLAGIGLLMMKPWGRTLAMIYGVSSLLGSLIYLGFVSVVLFVPLIQEAGQANRPEATGVAFGAIFGGSVVILLGMILPALLLIFMRKPAVVQAFQDRENPMQDAFGPEPTWPET